MLYLQQGKGARGGKQHQQCAFSSIGNPRTGWKLKPGTEYTYPRWIAGVYMCNRFSAR